MKRASWSSGGELSLWMPRCVDDGRFTFDEGTERVRFQFTPLPCPVRGSLAVYQKPSPPIVRCHRPT